MQLRQRFHLLVAAVLLFLLVYDGGSEEFLQRYNSARNPCPAGKRISMTTIQGGAIGFQRIPFRQRWSSVWNLADGRKNEQCANAVHAAQLFSILLDPRTFAEIQHASKIGKDRGMLNLRAQICTRDFFSFKIDDLFEYLFN